MYALIFNSEISTTILFYTGSDHLTGKMEVPGGYIYHHSEDYGM
jgi:hypothetical protein